MKGIPLNDNGKVIVARTAAELSTLCELHARSVANGVRVDLIDMHTLKDIEPSAKTIEPALYVKGTAVVNPQWVMAAVVADAIQEGVEFQLGCSWYSREGADLAKTSQGRIAMGMC
jgi:L-2-hydroxyglutarate oxidase